MQTIEPVKQESEQMNILQVIEKESPLGIIGSPSSSFEVVVDIRDISEKSKLLGELVCFPVQEGENTVLVIGQITEITTENRWHEEPAFKGIIKRHGRLPNLSGIADNRVGILNVQSSFLLNQTASPHKLANSPSTGAEVKRVNNKVMQELMSLYDSKSDLVTIGVAYDTSVKVPFWFKHFGNNKEGGAGDSYHIGVFGRTGSGKTTTAANMILGYARNKEHMSILILDPQEQFYNDNNVLPEGVKFQDKIKEIGMNFNKYKVPEDVALPNNAKLFSQLLLNYNFIKYAFDILTPEKTEEMAEAIERYMETRLEKDPQILKEHNLCEQLLKYFLKEENLKRVYSTKNKRQDVQGSIEEVLNNINHRARTIFNQTVDLFDDTSKTPLKTIVDKVVSKKSNVIVLNISGRGALRGMDDLETLYVKIIEDAIKEKGADLYAQGKQANCLVVLDEAHRFINTYSFNDKIKELTTSIIDAVRTTRKYGIGYMFITQTIESLHEEIRRQIRIFSFGYGLTSGSEFVKIKDIINDDAGAKFYRSFIDPASNNKFPFMFYGPISPLSFTGAPLFLEMKGELEEYTCRVGRDKEKGSTVC